MVDQIETINAKRGAVSSVPALKDAHDQWILEASGKADLFAEAFAKKNSLPIEVVNEYTALPRSNSISQRKLLKLSADDAGNVMAKLRIDSGTGPDLLPARILKLCSAALALPVLMLTICILTTGEWPQL